MQAPDKIADLLFKYLKNDLKPDEEIRLKEWRNDAPENEVIFQKLTDPEQLKEFLKDYYSRKNAWNKIVSLAPELKQKTTIRRVLSGPLSIAVTILLIIGLSIFIWIMIYGSSSRSEKEKQVTAKYNASDSVTMIQAVTNKAMLTLSDGKQIALDTGKSNPGSLGNNIQELDSGKLLYNHTDLVKTDKETFNILSTPRGGQFQLSLPDGSRVWLNAASMIKYPIAFLGKEREVEIRGEVYFEVTKDAKRPFIVSIGDNQVEVLGTHFNINSYADEPKTSITLLEGSIRFLSATEKMLLKPGEELQVSNISGNQKMDLLKNVDLSAITSWRTGTTRFKDASVQYIMRIISRWYNLDVNYEGKIPDRNITGGISKNESLPELLKVLEWNKIHYTIKGNQITITP